MSCTRVPHVYEYTHLALQYSRAAENNNNTCIKRIIKFRLQIFYMTYVYTCIPGTVPGTCTPGTGTCNHKKVTVIVIRDTCVVHVHMTCTTYIHTS